MPLSRTAFTAPGRRFRHGNLVLVALSLMGGVAQAQTAAPAVSTILALSGSSATGNLVKGTDGALYGVTAPSTTIAAGILFRTTLDGSRVTTLYQMAREEVNSPVAGLLLASNGQFYGTTKFGRASDANGGSGTIYRINADGTGFTVIHRFEVSTTANQELFPVNTEGALPEGELIEGNDGYLYGTTRAGGANGTGVIYKVLPDGTNYTVLHQFAAITSTTASGLTVTTDGAYPVAQLLLAPDGLLYGTASSGGANGRGTVFRMAFDGAGFEVLHAFSATTADTTTGLLENADGATPLSGLTAGGDGLLYGVTSSGGTLGAGVIFSITPVGGTFAPLHSFDMANGTRPIAELLLASDNRLYGTTFSGGQSSTGTATTFGTMFSFDPTGAGFTRLYTFDSTQGSGPSSKLIEIGSGKFVGATTTSGSCGYGTVFQYSAAGETVTGNTKCGRKKGDNAYGSGAVTPALLLLLGGFGWVRRRRG
jgi:uncharacterized repeat protein (TIGR03803 family)